MRRRAILSSASVLVLVCVALWWAADTKIDPGRVTLYVAIVVAGVTSIYVILTYEMARANSESVRVTELSLRFSLAPNLVFQTISAKDPSLEGTGIVPIQNHDYEMALKENSKGSTQPEYVFAVVRNIGRGPATMLRIQAEYNLIQGQGPNRAVTVSKTETIPLLQPERAVALCVYTFSVPTGDDSVEIIRATIKASDIYKDFLRESPNEKKIEPANHDAQPEPGCIVRIK